MEYQININDFDPKNQSIANIIISIKHLFLEVGRKNYISCNLTVDENSNNFKLKLDIDNLPR